MKRFARQMTPNEGVMTFFILDALELRTSRNKKTFLQLTLSDRSGSIRGYFWGKDPDRTAGFLKPGRFVKVAGTTKMMNGSLILNVKKIQNARKSEINPADFTRFGQLELFDFEAQQMAWANGRNEKAA